MADTMLYEAQGLQLDLSKITRLYPAAIVEGGGAEAQVSLEWAELKKDEVKIAEYVLVFDFDPPGEVPAQRKLLHFETKAALFETMQTLSDIFEKAYKGA
ncbi:hypothetical protein ACXWTF_03640 [Thiomicrolovo sp. ZZH C-3]